MSSNATFVQDLESRLEGLRKYKKQIQQDFVEYKIGAVKDELQ